MFWSGPITLFLLHFSNLHFILNISKKKGELHSLCISETLDGERSGYVNV